MARLRHFLNGTILFSSISPNYEQTLKEELFGCFKYIGIPFDQLNKMPTRDRKYYIMKHNNEMEKQNNRKKTLFLFRERLAIMRLVKCFFIFTIYIEMRL